MALFKSETPEQRAERERQKGESRAAKEREREEMRFNASPVGQARAGFARGDQLFQASFDLENVKAIVVAMTDAYTARSGNDVSDILNSIAVEGWDLHSFSTAFVNEGEVSRDKFMSSGQQVAVRGRLVGTYVFSRKAGHHPASPR